MLPGGLVSSAPRVSHVPWEWKSRPVPGEFLPVTDTDPLPLKGGASDLGVPLVPGVRDTACPYPS